ncbi:MAG: endonuclease NucS domain-containing protein, partial [Sphingomonas oligoaromativorans]
RQYSTTVGPIDLLARDKKTGQYVVIELKKGRSADKVYGQLSRYMGWVKANLAGGAEVMGVIVGSKIDDKLRSAVSAHATKVLLVEFESKMSVSVV